MNEIQAPVIFYPNGVDGDPAGEPISLPIDEPARRRPGFVDGVPVLLGNGQRWVFPVPKFADFFAVLDRDGNPQLRRGFDMGPGYDTLLSNYVDCDNPAGELAVLSVMAHRLLSRNYTLLFADMRYLLRIKVEDDPDVEANRDMWSQIADVAVGNSPKTSPAG